MRRNQLEWPRRKRAESTTPIRVEMRKQLGRVGDAGEPDVDRELDATAPNARHPLLHHARIEAEVADDVGRDAPLVPHRLDGQVVVDEAVALGIAR